MQALGGLNKGQMLQFFIIAITLRIAMNLTAIVRGGLTQPWGTITTIATTTGADSHLYGEHCFSSLPPHQGWETYGVVEFRDSVSLYLVG